MTPPKNRSQQAWHKSLWVWSALCLLPLPAILELTGSVNAAILFGVFAAPIPRVVVWFKGWLQFWVGEPHRRRKLGVVIVAFAVLASTAKMSRLEARLAASEMVTSGHAETVYLPPPLLLKVAALGYSTFVADVMFIRAAHYFHRHFESDRIFRHLKAYVKTVSELDPYNRRLYEWAGQAIKMSQQITAPVVEESISYAKMGLEHFPDYWRLYWDIGFNYLSEYPFETQEEADKLRERALPYLALAASLPDSELDPNLLAVLYRRGSDSEMAMFHLYLNYWNASPEQRKQMRNKLLKGGGNANAERLERLEALWLADKPYVPIFLYDLLRLDKDASRYPAGPKDNWANAANSVGTSP